MNLTQLLFSFKGRINRKPWWLATMAVGAAASILTAVLEAVARVSGHAVVNPEASQIEPTGVLGLAMLAVGLANMWIGFALGVKRLHDRDRTGWWLVWQFLILALAVVMVVVAVALQKEQAPLWYALAGGASLAAIIVSV